MKVGNKNAARHNHRSGNKQTQAYTAWQNMRKRCKPGYIQEKDYLGRGITVCERWARFDEFLADMGEPGKGMSLDRIDNDKGYSPDNCRWADKRTQRINSRNVYLVTWRGRTQCIALWAEEIGVKYSSLYTRFRRGWTAEKALTQPLKIQISS